MGAANPVAGADSAHSAGSADSANSVAREFVLDGDRIRLGDAVLVYLERTQAPQDPVPEGTVPQPYGVAPLALTPERDVIAAVWPGEAIWLGFQAVNRAVTTTLRIRIDDEPAIDALTGQPWTGPDAGGDQALLRCPPDFSCLGPPAAGGRRLFGTGRLDRFTVLAGAEAPARVTIELLRPVEFTRICGRSPTPPAPERAFPGYRLP